MSQARLLSALATTLPKVVNRRLRRGPARPSWTFGYELVAASFRATTAGVTDRPYEVVRRAFDSMPLPTSKGLVGVTREKVDARGVPSEWFTPAAHDDQVVLYFHGGGYVFGSTRSHRPLISRIATASRARVLGANYRLAPENPFPAAVDDAYAVYQWLTVDRKIAPSKIVVSGDSAGGGLSAALLLKLRDLGEPLPAGAALICPWVDFTAKGGSIIENGEVDFTTNDVAQKWIEAYLGGKSERTNPLASPGLADLRGLPPLLVQVGGAETLLDQVKAFAKRATEAGVDVRLSVGTDMIHVWHSFADFFDVSRRSIEEIGHFVKRVTR